MSAARCDACPYFKQHGAAGGGVGECRESPPSIVVVTQRSIEGLTQVPISAFPTVSVDSWCGNHPLLFADEPEIVVNTGQVN